jgi:hypothetical protein
MGVIDTLKNLAGLQEATQSFRPEVNLTATQLLRQTPQTAVNVQLQEFQRGQAKDLQLQQISQQQQQLQEYLKTPSGIYQYAQESGIQPEVKTEQKSYFVDGAPLAYKETTYTYNTPQGTTSYTESDLGNQLKELGQSRSLIPGQTQGTLQYNPEVTFLYGNPSDWNESNFAIPNKPVTQQVIQKEFALPPSKETPTVMAYNSQTGVWGSPQPYVPTTTTEPISNLAYEEQLKRIQDAGLKTIVSGDKITGLEGYGQSVMLGGSVDTSKLDPKMKFALEKAGVITKPETKPNVYMPSLPGLVTSSGETYWGTAKENWLIDPRLITPGNYLPNEGIVDSNFLAMKYVDLPKGVNNNLTPNQLNQALLNPFGFKNQDTAIMNLDANTYTLKKLNNEIFSAKGIAIMDLDANTYTLKTNEIISTKGEFKSNYSPLTFLSSQSAEYSLLPIPFTDKGFSASGLHDWFGESFSRAAQNQKLYVSDIPPYKLRGSMSPETFTLGYKVVSSKPWNPANEFASSNLFKDAGLTNEDSFGTPNQFTIVKNDGKSEITKTKTDIFSLIGPEQQKAILDERNRVAGNTARFVGMGVVYAGEYAINPSVALGLNMIEGAEKFFTPKGKEVTRQINQAYGPVIAYGIPVLQIVGGAWGISNAYMNAQAKALQSAKGYRSLTESQPFSKTFEMNGKEYTDYFSKQITTKKINSPGFANSIKTEIVPRNPMDLSKGFVRRFVKEPTLFGDRIINPTLTVASQQELIPIAGGYAFSGFAKAGMSVQNPLTGNFKTVITKTNFPVGGIATPRDVAKFMGQDFKPAYSGEAWAGMGTKKIRESFGGIPVSEAKSGITTVVSGPYNKMYQWSDIDLRGVPQREFSSFAKVKTPGVGYVYPEIDLTSNVDKGFTFIKRMGKRGQVSLNPLMLESQSPTLSISSTQSTNQLLNDFIGSAISSVGAKQIPLLPTTYPIPSLWVNTKSESPTKYVSTPSFSLLTKTDTITIPKVINIPTPKPSETDWVNFGSKDITKIIEPPIIITPPIIEPPIIITPPIIQPPIQFYMKPTPPPITTIDGFTPPQTRKVIKPAIKGKGLFITEFRRRGKFFPIAQTTSLPFAVAVGKKAARQTLGASFRIRKPTGAIFPIQPTQEFRLGKGEGILVQGSRVRLSSGFERKEIARSRIFTGHTIYPKGSKNLFGMTKITKTTKNPFTF